MILEYFGEDKATASMMQLLVLGAILLLPNSSFLQNTPYRCSNLRRFAPNQAHEKVWEDRITPGFQPKVQGLAHPSRPDIGSFVLAITSIPRIFVPAFCKVRGR